MKINKLNWLAIIAVAFVGTACGRGSQGSDDVESRVGTPLARAAGYEPSLDMGGTGTITADSPENLNAGLALVNQKGPSGPPEEIRGTIKAALTGCKDTQAFQDCKQKIKKLISQRTGKAGAPPSGDGGSARPRPPQLMLRCLIAQAKQHSDTPEQCTGPLDELLKFVQQRKGQGPSN